MSTGEPEATIAIPAHDARSRIGQVLEALAAQQGPPAFELLVVDNASRDGTAEAVLAHPATRAIEGRGMAVRVVREDQLGLTHARRRAVREARGALVCFLDDDTVPSPTYVATGVAAMSDPRVGLLVSRVSPEWVDHPPPPSLARRAHLFAVNEALGDAPIEWTATIAPTLGAGMWVRRQAFLECVDHSPSLMADRQGRALTSGGDIEIGCLIGRGGWRRLYVPGLRLSHRIPGRRFELSYACRLIWGIERSTATIESRYGSPPSRVKAAVGLAIAVSAAPLLLLRRDGARELVFALTRRAGRLRGPL